MKKKIVVIGGGTGTYQVLSGLKKHDLDISAVISMSDSGGSTGRLRKELGVLPPGDLRQAVLALSDLPFAQKTLEKMFNFRFDKGKSLAGHSLGNILLAALTQITGSMDKAIEEAARILNVNGSVYPATLKKTNLVALLEDGSRVYGETNIDKRKFKLAVPIKRVYLSPKAKVLPAAKRALESADVIVLGPGDLYTSIIPVLLVGGVDKAIQRSKAKVLFVMNLVTKKAETKGFKAADFVNEIKKYLGSAASNLSHVFINRLTKNRKEVVAWYKKYGSAPVENNIGNTEGLKVIEKDFLDKTTFFRHDPNKIAKAILSLV